jgi:hypothetical protein
MKSLLYSDWCVIKGNARQYPLPAFIIVAVVIFTGITDLSGDVMSLVMGIHSTVVSTGVMMISFFGYFALFGNDEREGWEALRLALPVTRRTVVRSRYLTLLMWVVALELAINLLALLGCAVASLALYGTLAFAPANEILLLNGVLIAVYLVYLGIENPVMFKLGLSKGRLYFSLPFLLCMLFTVEPVKNAATAMLGKLEALSTAVGSPLVLVAPAIVLSLDIYYASSLVAERIYARRDF